MVMITKLKCKRCGHEWVRRLETLPKACPKCRNPYWDKERRALLKLKYLDYEDIIEINRRVLKGLPVKKADRHKVLSLIAIMDISNEYRTIEGDLWDKAGYLLRELVRKHPFASGNRRTAMESVILFLKLNDERIGVRNVKNNDKILQGIREEHYSKTEIREWLLRGEIRDFDRQTN